MNHWPFIIAAYALTILGTAGVTLWALVTMRRAEKTAESLRSSTLPFVPSEVEGRGERTNRVSTSLDTNGFGRDASELEGGA